MGVGNVLMHDDALGPYVLESLKARYDLPPEVTVFDAGTPGLDLTLFLVEFDALIAVDALKGQGAPGEVKTYTRAQLLEGALPITMSPHEPTLREALMRMALVGRGPSEVLLVGAIPEVVKTGTGLSPRVLAAVPEIEQHVLRELVRLGARVAPRMSRQQPDLWWERPAA
ncbi:MAG: hydrogenase maturation protease [Myxococcales bacterium]